MTDDELVDGPYVVVLRALRHLFPRMLAPDRVAAGVVVALENAGMLRSGTPQAEDGRVAL